MSNAKRSEQATIYPPWNVFEKSDCARESPRRDGNRRSKAMSSKREITINLQNDTQGLMSLTAQSLNSDAYWITSPPSQIASASGTVASFHAKGYGGLATGVAGSVTYTLPDNATTYTITFNVPYPHNSVNSGGGTFGGTSPGNYTGQETDSTYQNPVSFPTGGDSPTVYFALGLHSSATRHFDFAKAVADRLTAARNEKPPRSIDIVEVARNADCGEISGPQLIEAFRGQTVATARDILGADNIPVADRVDFVSNRGLISSTTSFAAAVEFAANVSDGVLGDDGTVHDLAEETIEALRAFGKGTPERRLNTLVDELERAKFAMLAQRVLAPQYPKIYAIEAILASVYMNAGAALAQAGSCARNTGADAGASDAIAAWQLQYLQSKV
jgi:hypothetical protein